MHSCSMKLSLAILLAPLVLLLSAHVAVAEDDDIVHASCIHASYPTICVRTLSSYPDPPKTPREIAQAALKVSIVHATKLSNFLAQQTAYKSKREKNALKDCLEQMGDSMDELEKSLSELGKLSSRSGYYNYKFRMANAQTWVSAALTDEETCLDGLREAGKVKEDVKRKIVGVAKVTSNALYFINQLIETKRP